MDTTPNAQLGRVKFKGSVYIAFYPLALLLEPSGPLCDLVRRMHHWSIAADLKARAESVLQQFVWCQSAVRLQG